MPKIIDGWEAPHGICPSCFRGVDGVATRGEAGWYIMARCPCRHINDMHPWPFEEGILEPEAADFSRAGLVVEIDEAYEERLEELDVEYMDEVDHGWERSWH